MSSVRPPKPSNLPSSFKPTGVEWKAVTLPAFERGVEYSGRIEARSGRPRPPKGTLELKPEQTTVWVCEPDAAAHAQVQGALEQWKFRVKMSTEASSLRDALSGGETPHLLLVSCDLRGAGVELAREFVKRVPDIEVVFLASSSDLVFALEAKGTGVHELVLKPILRLEDLRAAVANALLRVHQRLYTRFMIEEFERRERSLQVESRLTEELNEKVGLDDVLQAGCRALAEMFDGATAATAVFLRYAPAQRSLVATARAPELAFAGASPKLMVPPEVRGDLASVKAFLSGLESQPEFCALMAQASQMDPESPEADEWRTCALETRGIPRGVLALRATNWNESSDRPKFTRFAQNLAQRYEIALLHKKLRESLIEDSFTGLANARYLDRRLREETLKASRLKHPLSVLIMERIAVAGETPIPREKYLKLLSKQVHKGFRTTDLLAYRGGDQLAIVLPHTAFVDALQKAERFRKQVLESSQGALSLAIGVAEYPGHAPSPEELLFAAETACREAHDGSQIHIADVRPGYVPAFVPDSPRSQFAPTSETST